MSDFLRLTDVEGRDLRVHYQAIDVIGHATFPLCGVDIKYVNGARLTLDNGQSFIVREAPDYIEHLIEAICTECQIDMGGDIDTDEEEWG